MIRSLMVSMLLLRALKNTRLGSGGRCCYGSAVFKRSIRGGRVGGRSWIQGSEKYPSFGASFQVSSSGQYGSNWATINRGKYACRIMQFRLTGTYRLSLTSSPVLQLPSEYKPDQARLVQQFGPTVFGCSFGSVFEPVVHLPITDEPPRLQFHIRVMLRRWFPKAHAKIICAAIERVSGITNDNRGDHVDC